MSETRDVEHAKDVFRSGFVAVLGRPNVGKSTLVNALVGGKVSITASSPNTTRNAIQGVLNGEHSQIVLVDTPGMHKPRSALGQRLNQTATAASQNVDACLVVIDAHESIGPGDRFAADTARGHRPIVVVNKADLVARQQMLDQLLAAQRELDLEESEFFPVSAKDGDGVAALLEHLRSLLPEGPRYYPAGVIRNVPDEFFVAELVREQLLLVAREELPHSIACRVTEWDWPYIRCEVLVERESQKGIVIGHDASVIKQAGVAARAQLPEGCFLELVVRVVKDWQQKTVLIERLGY